MGYAAQDMGNDIKVNLQGQHEKLKKVHGNLTDIQAQTTVSGKLMAAIEAQRAKNKYVLWFIYFLIACLAAYVLAKMFGIGSGSNNQ